jgi:hypothetical protein
MSSTEKIDGESSSETGALVAEEDPGSVAHAFWSQKSEENLRRAEQLAQERAFQLQVRVRNTNDDNLLYRVEGHRDPGPLATVLPQARLKGIKDGASDPSVAKQHLPGPTKGRYIVGSRRLSSYDAHPKLIASISVQPLAPWSVDMGPECARIRRPPFNTDMYEPCIAREKLEKLLGSFAVEGDPTPDFSVVPIAPCSSRYTCEYTEAVAYAFRSWFPASWDFVTVCESSPNLLHDLYDTITIGCQQLYEQGTRVCMGVVRRGPVVALLEAIYQCSGRMCFVPITREVDETPERASHGILLFTRPIGQAAETLLFENVMNDVYRAIHG